MRPELQMPLGMRGLEPFLRFMMDTAEETKQITEEYRAEQVKTNDHLAAIREILEHIVNPPVEEKTA